MPQEMTVVLDRRLTQTALIPQIDPEARGLPDERVGRMRPVVHGRAIGQRDPEHLLDGIAHITRDLAARRPAGVPVARLQPGGDDVSTCTGSSSQRIAP